MYPIVVCGRCRYDIEVTALFPRVGDVVVCDQCRARLRLVDVSFVPILKAELITDGAVSDDQPTLELKKPP